jgi:hypothetical protein
LIERLADQWARSDDVVGFPRNPFGVSRLSRRPSARHIWPGRLEFQESPLSSREFQPRPLSATFSSRA